MKHFDHSGDEDALDLRQAVGVEAGPGGVTVVAATRRRGGALLETWALDAPSLSADAQARLQRLLDRGGATVGALAVHESFLRRLTAPFPSIAKARRVFPSLLDIQLPFPLESCAYEFLAAHTTAQGEVTALAVAARREDITTALARHGAAGLDPVLLDHEGLALWTRSTREIPLPRDTWRVVLHLGHDHASAVLGRGAEPQSATGLRVGARDIQDANRSAAVVLQLASRLNTWLRAQLPNGPGPGLQWAWTGAGAADEALLAQVRARLVLPDDAHVFTHREPAAFLAGALAERAVQAGPMTCNLRRGDQAHAALLRGLARARRAVLGSALAAAALVIALNVGGLAYLAHRRDALQDAVQERARALAGAQRVPRGMEVMTAERAQQEQAARYLPFRAAFEPSRLGRLADLLAAAAAHNLTIEQVAVRPASIVCAGTAVDWADCEAIAAGLQREGWRADVERRDAGADERVHFTVKALR